VDTRKSRASALPCRRADSRVKASVKWLAAASSTKTREQRSAA
jgi:hypothetical protein